MEKTDNVLEVTQSPTDSLTAAATDAPVAAEQTFAQSLLTAAIGVAVIAPFACVAVTARSAIAVIDTTSKVIGAISDIVLPLVEKEEETIQFTEAPIEVPTVTTAEFATVIATTEAPIAAIAAEAPIAAITEAPIESITAEAPIAPITAEAPIAAVLPAAAAVPIAAPPPPIQQVCFNNEIC